MHEPLNVRPLEQARSEFSEFWEPSPSKESVSVENAGGRILAENVKSKVDLPPFNRSSYDGFAVRAEDTVGAEEDDPVELNLKGEVYAGEKPDVSVEKGTCVGISTGAVIPEGANAVVMVEDTSKINGKIEIRSAVPPGKNVSEKGSEIEKGEVIAKSGRRISPQIHGALSAAGVRNIEVFKKPEVAIITSGEELVPHDQELEIGQIYDVNGLTIFDAVKASGGNPHDFGIVRDEISEIKERVKESLSRTDVVITSGGSSAGPKDILPMAIDELGEPGVIVHGLAQKPGKPTILSVLDGKPVFGLPGYPVSALMVYDQLVAPYIRELAGVPQPNRGTIRANLTRKVIPARGRRELLPVQIIQEKEGCFAKPLRQGSGKITSLADSDGYVDIPIGREILEKDEVIEVNLFGEGELA